jgi:hypothetical protein
VAILEKITYTGVVARSLYGTGLLDYTYRFAPNSVRLTCCCAAADDRSA